MIGSIGLVVVGLAALAGGGELLVRGGTGVGRLARVSPTVIGLTIVAAGTSMPELVVSLRAALAGSTALAMGNVVGSNIFNIAALISPLSLTGRTVRFELPVMALAAWQLHLLARDGTVDRLEGGFLLSALVVFLVYIVRVARRETGETEQRTFAEATPPALGGDGGRAWAASLAAVVLGVGALAIGAELLVRGAVDIAVQMHVPEAIVGLTVVAAGTSLPELAATLVASFRGRDDIAVANVLGSNIFNVLGIAGLTALVTPMPVPSMIVEQDDLWMLGLSLVLLPIMRTGYRVSRLEGLLLFGAFAAYLAQLASRL